MVTLAEVTHSQNNSNYVTDTHTPEGTIVEGGNKVFILNLKSFLSLKQLFMLFYFSSESFIRLLPNAYMIFLGDTRCKV